MAGLLTAVLIRIAKANGAERVGSKRVIFFSGLPNISQVIFINFTSVLLFNILDREGEIIEEFIAKF